MRKRIPAVVLAWFCIARVSSSAPAVIYSYTGTTASGGSAITAWFQFDSSAMSDGLVFFYEIPQHSFHISGDVTAMNGEYDYFMGGGIDFASAVPGPQNLPTFQSLVIQNSSSRYFVQSDSLGDPGIFIGGADGTGTVYSGRWSFGQVPEPTSAILLVLGASLILTLRHTSAEQMDAPNPAMTSQFQIGDQRRRVGDPRR